MGSQLLLMRHAKSAHGDATLADHDRPLNDRGRRDTPRMASWMADQGCLPDRILCSSSTRTRETAQLLCDSWDHAPEVVVLKPLYLAEPDGLLEMLAENHGGCAGVMILAHNPGISELASALAGRSLEMPTAAVAVFKVDDFDGFGTTGLSTHAPLSLRISHLGKQGGGQLTHFGSPKTIELGS